MKSPARQYSGAGHARTHTKTMQQHPAPGVTARLSAVETSPKAAPLLPPVAAEPDADLLADHAARCAQAETTGDDGHDAHRWAAAYAAAATRAVGAGLAARRHGGDATSPSTAGAAAVADAAAATAAARAAAADAAARDADAAAGLAAASARWDPAAWAASAARVLEAAAAGPAPHLSAPPPPPSPARTGGEGVSGGGGGAPPPPPLVAPGRIVILAAAAPDPLVALALAPAGAPPGGPTQPCWVGRVERVEGGEGGDAPSRMLVRWLLPDGPVSSAAAAPAPAASSWAPAPGAPPEWMPAGAGAGLLSSCSRLGGSGALPNGMVRSAAARLAHLLEVERGGGRGG